MGKVGTVSPIPLRTRMVIVGNFEDIHVGHHLARAAEALGLTVSRCDTRDAFRGPRWLVRLSWRFLGRRPLALRRFSQLVFETCTATGPTYLVATGIAPVTAGVLRGLRAAGTITINYLTDDPWNSAQRSGWFLAALREYDHVFSTRRSNLTDLAVAGCKRISYLPFAYDPEIHFPDTAVSDTRDTDVVFVGGGDADRVPYVAALAQAGINVTVYGGYWEQFSQVAHLAKGMADPPTMRRAISGARISLCLVRRANRDGHAMRTFEVPAIGACMLVEDTDEHREIFGEDGHAVVYFRSIAEMVERARWLLEHEDARQCLAKAVHRLIVGRNHTYRDRLVAMLPISGLAAETCRA